VETEAKGAVAELAPPSAMASLSKASDSSSQRSKVRAASLFHVPRVHRPDLPNLIGFDSLPVFCALQRSDQGMMCRDAAAASAVPIHGNLTQLIRQIKSGRLAYIKVSDRARPDHHVTEISGAEHRV